MKWNDRNCVATLLKDQLLTLLHLASIELRHLAQPHVNFDSAEKHTAVLVSLEDCANAFKDKDNERFIRASVRKRSLYYEKNGEWVLVMINSHVKYFHLTECSETLWPNHIAQNE